MTISLLTTPEINESRETQFVVQEVQSPHTRQLGTGIGVSVFVTLKELLIQQLYRPCLREISRMSIVGGTDKTCLLETGRTAQTSVVLYMSRKGDSLPSLISREISV